jgi:hypothetical protein
MRIRLSQFLLVPVTSLFCVLAFAATLPSAGQDLSLLNPIESGVFFTATHKPGNRDLFDVAAGKRSMTQEALLLADDQTDDQTQKYYVCHVLVNGKWVTQEVDKAAYDKLINDFSGQGDWLPGKCEEVMSPS